MITLAVDSATRDLTIDLSGKLRTIDNYADHARQAVELTLRAWLGDWMLDLDHGTDYKAILGTAASDQQAERMIRDALSQVQEIWTVDEVTISRRERELILSVVCTARDGSAIRTEVVAG